MANPLDAFAGKPATFSGDFRVPPLPKFREKLSGKSLVDAVKAHDDALEEWRQQLERAMALRLPVPSAAATTVAAPSTPTGVVNAPVTSVNGETGDVQLSSDDIDQGSVNLYMTPAGWSTLFDQLGYQRNYIAPTESVSIPANRNAVIAGPLVIDGMLTVDGYLAMIAVP